jgi:hypothetical protein
MAAATCDVLPTARAGGHLVASGKFNISNQQMAEGGEGQGWKGNISPDFWAGEITEGEDYRFLPEACLAATACFFFASALLASALFWLFFF